MSARRAMLAKVHVARKRMALDEDSYRGLLRRVTGRGSAGDCTDGELHAVLAEFRRLGFDATPRPPPGPRAQLRMIAALWAELAPCLSDTSEEALRAFVRRQTADKANPRGVMAVEWLDAQQANKVIEGLKAWLKRERARFPKDDAERADMVRRAHARIEECGT